MKKVIKKREEKNNLLEILKFFYKNNLGEAEDEEGFSLNVDEEIISVIGETYYEFDLQECEIEVANGDLFKEGYIKIVDVDKYVLKINEYGYYDVEEPEAIDKPINKMIFECNLQELVSNLEDAQCEFSMLRDIIGDRNR